MITRIFAVVAAFILVIPLLAISAKADTQLGSGNASFIVNPIILFDIPLEEGQYCGNPKYPQTQNFKLSLVGDTKFLNIRWNAKDPGGIERQIGVDCWLNCPANSNLQSNCAGFQACSYRGPTGDHACTVSAPVYNFNTDNRVVCRFFDPVLPLLDLVIDSRVFKTTDYEINTPPITITVGQPATAPIAVKSFGILENSYTNNITTLQSSQLVLVQGGFGNTENVTCGQVGSTFPRVTFLSAINAPFTVLSHNSVDTTSCTTDSQCSYLSDTGFSASCMQGKCWRRLDLNINAGVASLAEYNILGFIAIVAASVGIFFFARRKL